MLSENLKRVIVITKRVVALGCAFSKCLPNRANIVKVKNTPKTMATTQKDRKQNNL